MDNDFGDCCDVNGIVCDDCNNDHFDNESDDCTDNAGDHNSAVVTKPAFERQEAAKMDGHDSHTQI